jgi:hypothetical protein
LLGKETAHRNILIGYGLSSGSLFLLSHSLVTDEVYTAGLRDVLGEFRARSLLILDESHHAAPASGSRYAVDSQFTRAIEARNRLLALIELGFR